MNEPRLDDFAICTCENTKDAIAATQESIRIATEFGTFFKEEREAIRRLFSLDAVQFARACDAVRPFVVDDPRCFVAAVNTACDHLQTEGLPVV